jgi:hypothetical protein
MTSSQHLHGIIFDLQDVVPSAIAAARGLAERSRALYKV